MTTATQQRPASNGAMATEQADTGARILQEILDKPVEYTPFLSKQSITLSARMVLRYLCTPTKSGKVCDERQAIRFVRLCQARGLNPWEGDAYIVGYDSADGPAFSLITAHQAFLKRAEVHPEYDGMESGVIVRRGDDTVEMEGDFFEDGDKLLGAWARIHLKHRRIPVYRRLKLTTVSKGFGRWKIDPAGMAVKCAEADALRSAFPNALGGMYLDNEVREDEVAEVSATRTAPPTIRTVFKGPKSNGVAYRPAPAEPESQDGAAGMPPEESVESQLDTDGGEVPNEPVITPEDMQNQDADDRSLEIEALIRQSVATQFGAIRQQIQDDAMLLGRARTSNLLAMLESRGSGQTAEKPAKKR